MPDQFFSRAEELPGNPVPHIETVESFVQNTGAGVSYGGTKACYRPSFDDILMPDRGRFDSEVHLYSTLLHEVSHWSGANRRLDRDLKCSLIDRRAAETHKLVGNAESWLSRRVSRRDESL